MFFWLTAALLTLAASTAVLWPFLRAPAAAPEGAGHDIEVYRDQLREVERDAGAGLVGAAEAEEARAEIGRRILRLADGKDGGASRLASDRAGRLLVSAAVLAVPVLGWGAYAVLGSPALPDQRLEARLTKSPAESSMDELVARAELHLQQNPQDGRGWDVLAPIYLRMGRNDDAVTAFRNAIRLDGTSAQREGGLGEALIAAAQGIVSADAQAAFERALAVDPKDARARYFLALGYSQEGKDAAAADLWRQMAADLPADSPWRGAAQQELARLGAPEAADQAASGPAPGAGEVKAAMEMSSEDRLAMIEGMVSQLDARLRDNPADLDGWQRLVRSYQVLGRQQDAQDALARGVTALGAGSAEAARLTAFASGLGVTQQ
jgi:cytochrome c-type biogenesis protein CcmH